MKNLQTDEGLYHEPERIVHLPQHLRGFRGDGRHPTAPQQRIQPRGVHRIKSQTDVVLIIQPIQINRDMGQAFTHLTGD